MRQLAGDDGMDALVISLLAWIAAKAEFGVVEAPRVVFVPKHQFETALVSQSFFRLQGLYLPGTGTIYLPATWRSGSLNDQSYLLHELVHHAQIRNKVSIDCPGALERQAYDLQTTWLREQGVIAPFELIGIDEFTMVMLSACMPPDL